MTRITLASTFAAALLASTASMAAPGADTMTDRMAAPAAASAHMHRAMNSQAFEGGEAASQVLPQKTDRMAGGMSAQPHDTMRSTRAMDGMRAAGLQPYQNGAAN